MRLLRSKPRPRVRHVGGRPDPSGEINLLVIAKPSGVFAWLYWDGDEAEVLAIANQFFEDPEIEFNLWDLQLLREKLNL